MALQVWWMFFLLCYYKLLCLCLPCRVLTPCIGGSLGLFTACCDQLMLLLVPSLSGVHPAVSGYLTPAGKVRQWRGRDMGSPLHMPCPRYGKDPITYHPRNPLRVVWARTSVLGLSVWKGRVCWWSSVAGHLVPGSPVCWARVARVVTSCRRPWLDQGACLHIGSLIRHRRVPCKFSRSVIAFPACMNTVCIQVVSIDVC